MASILAGMSAVAVLLRSRSSLAGKLFAVGMLLLAVESAFNHLSFRQLQAGNVLSWQELRYVPLAFLPVTWVAFGLVYSRGNYREYLRNWRIALLLLGVVPALTLLTGSDALLFQMPDPERVDQVFLALGWGAQLIHFAVLTGAVLLMMNLEQTFRSSVGTQRWRLKLVVLGVGALFVVRTYTSSQALLYKIVSEPMEQINAGALVVCCLLIGYSILRTREFSIDLYPSQAALHRSLIVIAVGAYLVVVGLLAKLAAILGGDSAFQARALVILAALILLALLLMSDTVRERSRAWLERHFNRPHYNYQALWSSYTRATAGCATESVAGETLAHWVSKNLNALSVSVWLLDEPRNDLALAGTTLEPDHREPAAGTRDASVWPVIVQSVVHLEPIVNLDRAGDRPVATLAGLHPRVFAAGGDRLAVRLAAGGRALGVLIVGDRVRGVPFTKEDQQLLVTVADQAASLLQNIRLSRRLVEAREMEAFQSMSTFFVHDLKNTASSLSLMLQNLPRHFDNPEFRADALRSIGRSVQRINQMIQSLSALRRELMIDPHPGDLAELRGRVQQLAADRNIVLEEDFQAAGPVRMDLEQIHRVVTNLVVNAQEASAPGSPVRVSTGRQDGMAFLAVQDQGSGMTDEFIRRQLFRPFQTTKKTGTGIGLYHSRMIVDAHAGRMEVQSQPGSGTVMRFWLPLTTVANEARSSDN